MVRHKRIIKNFILSLSVVLTGCVSVPEGIQPVQGFNLNRYLGKWYEIARLDHSFERGLVSVTAEYSLRDDGGVKVVNRGFDPAGNKWKEAAGKAYFTGEKETGALKVSFFGPFYGSYNIIDLDRENYSYALVCGPDRSYLWILARTPDPGKKIIERLVQKGSSLGFDTGKLIYIVHK